MIVRKSEFIKYVDDFSDIAIERMDIDVDTADELPAVDAIPGKIIGMGSIGWAINDGDFYGLNSDGEWIKQGAESE